MQKQTSCWYLLILVIKLSLHKFDANPAISHLRYLELFFPLRVRDSGVLLYCAAISMCLSRVNSAEQVLLISWVDIQNLRVIAH